MFCHLGQNWEDWIDSVLEQDHIKTWITVRSPIHTWGTHYGHLYAGRSDNNLAAYEKLGQLRGQYETLQKFAPRVGYIHRVEMDPLSKLGDYLGLELKEHNKTFSNPTPMKEALMNKDLPKIEQLAEGTEFYTAFRDYTTPEFKDFFEDLGYDIWWTNG